MTDIRKDNLPERAPSKRIDEILAQPYEFMKCRGLTYEARRDFLQLATEVKHLRRVHDLDGLIAEIREREWAVQRGEIPVVYINDIEEIIRKHFGKE